MSRGVCKDGVLTYLAVLARVAVGTDAAVLVWLGVHARPSVHTRPVTPAVIQVCPRVCE